jgi:hypothetical protein
MGFKREEAEQALAILAALARSADLDVAMDLARFVRIPLPDAAMALDDPRRLRRLGFTSAADVRSEVAGMAEAYTHTLYGQWDVREAQGLTVSAAARRLAERMFGPR